MKSQEFFSLLECDPDSVFSFACLGVTERHYPPDACCYIHCVVDNQISAKHLVYMFNGLLKYV